ncbi:response regulator receiver domain-containing protein [Hasllibacter halocynthiae]|uniref:Response regulator receiver domain-containing protein n=1 Tax=Hasllibacter halocynthiae TaxID=595589 RepID=A0A2T0X1Q2_9RHOB|nr:response regulator [Hasllibacter halocynthiae]PRY92876.1 response regulator receiver domain-containing protein [Hasllibacter halocynthiae]
MAGKTDRTDTRTGTILVVEDETLIAMDIEATLREGGYDDVHVATSAGRAGAYLDAATPSAALLDVNLGRDETSVELARLLDARGCPILFMTGYTASAVALPGALSEAPRLSKPFEEGELLDALAALLRP